MPTVLNIYISQAIIDEFSIQQIKKGYYQYLSIPFDINGPALNYFETIKQKFSKALHSLVYLCSSQNIPEFQRLIYYKTTVRSRLEYGAQILYYTPSQLKKLEGLQDKAYDSC